MCKEESNRKNKSRKVAHLGKAAVSFNADQLGTEETHIHIDIPSIGEIEQNLKTAKEENLRLKAENESLIRSLLVKSDLLKATLTAKNAGAPTNEQLEQKGQDDNTDEEGCSYPTFGTKLNVFYPDQDSKVAVKAAASAAAAGTCTPMDSDEPEVAKLTTSPATDKVTTYQRQSSYSFNCNPTSDINYSDVTSSMIVIRSHQGNLKLLLQEAEEEGLSTDLMASIESTVAETNKIYSDIVSQSLQHPTLNTCNLVRDGKFTFDYFDEMKVNHRSIAATILKRLSQQELMSLHGIWTSHSQKLELIQQKQARLEVMRTTLASAILKRRDESAARPKDCHQLNVNWKTRASEFLASYYLLKTARQVYWEEWDGIDKFEGTCCKVSRVLVNFLIFTFSAGRLHFFASWCRSLALITLRLCMRNLLLLLQITLPLQKKFSRLLKHAAASVWPPNKTLPENYVQQCFF